MLGGLVLVALLSMPLYARSAARGRPDPRASGDKGTFVLGGFVRDWFYWCLGPVDRAAVTVGLGPLFFNLTGVLMGVAAGVLFATDWMVAAGAAVLLGGVADILDGRVARALGLASRRGAFLDSSLDRFAEVAVFVGLAVRFRLEPLALTAVVVGLGGSLLVSYTRARGESVGVVCKLGVMQRAERLMLIGLAALVDPAVSGALSTGSGAAMRPALAVVALGTVGTAVFRTVWIARRLPLRD